MQLNLRSTEDLTIMQASGDPQELAAFVQLLGLVEVPVIVNEAEDVLADLVPANEVAF